MDADTAIIGGGLVGLAAAAALSARGGRVALIAATHAGEASRAAAGMLAPGVEHATGAAHAFAVAARDLYPSYVEALAEVTGIRVPLNREGILELVTDEAAVDTKRAEADAHGEWLSAEQLRALEPAVGPAAGAILYPHDGAVDNVALLRALRTLVQASAAVTVIDEAATAVELSSEPPVVRLVSGRRIAAATLVLAAGAWSPLVHGLPRSIPVEPVRGQMMAVAAAPLRHVTYGPTGYVVPRGHALTVVGSTMERAGFEVATTPDGLAALEATAAQISPALAGARTVDRWSGLRPVTPDLLPILGRDPDCPALIYACGHSRNGILLGPLSGECVAALASGEEPNLDITPFAVTRFAPPARGFGNR